MKLEKAIETAVDVIKTWTTNCDKDDIDAIKLLIEAGKLYQHNRLIGQHYDPALLPGETED